MTPSEPLIPIRREPFLPGRAGTWARPYKTQPRIRRRGSGVLIEERSIDILAVRRRVEAVFFLVFLRQHLVET